MTQIRADRILETAAITGTGPYTLLGAVLGYRTASSVCVAGDQFDYYASGFDAGGLLTANWETGLATWAAGNVLTRTTIYASSNAGLPVNWTSGTQQVALTVTATGLNSITESIATVATSVVDTQTMLLTALV